MRRIFEMGEAEMASLILEALTMRGELPAGEWSVQFQSHTPHPMSQASGPIFSARLYVKDNPA